MRYENAVQVFSVLAAGGRPSASQFAVAAESLSSAAIEFDSGDYAMAYKSLKHFAKYGFVVLSKFDKVLAEKYAMVLASEC